MGIRYLIFFLIFSYPVFGQIKESFDDGDLSNSGWAGNTSAFQVNSDKWLQSKGPASQTSIYISKSINFPIQEWTFTINFPFNPSASNFAKIYLTADNPNLTSPELNGYFLKLGGETGNSDAIELYKQEGKVFTKLIRGKEGSFGSSDNLVRIKVTYSNHTWKLFTDSSQIGNFVEEGQYMNDDPLTGQSHFGIVCIYTSTRADKFFFDDFIINPSPVEALKATVINPYQIDIILNQNLHNYSIDFAEVNTSTIANNHISVTDSLLTINLENPISYGKHKGVVHVYGLKNYLIDINFQVDFTRPIVYGDLVINEIFSDPSPSIGLPEFEYIELFNNSSDTINLKDFQIEDLSTVSILPDYKISPQSYLVLTSNQAVEEFNMPNIIGISDWPSLNNTSDVLSLKNKKEELIFKVEYAASWHGSKNKEGGYSLEMINPLYYCDNYNWRSSIAPLGGTPGIINSVFDATPDTEGPEIVRWKTDSTHISLTFNEQPDTTNLASSEVKLISEDGIIPLQLNTFNQKEIICLLPDNIVDSKNYHLQITSFFDCKRNKSRDTSIAIVFPSNEKEGDLIINEILFNPYPGSYDFVEIHNTSNYYFDLKNWNISNGKTASLITNQRMIIPPKGYLVLTEDKSSLVNIYRCEENNIYQASLPPLNDDTGTVILVNPGGIIREKFSYNEKFHSSILREVEGISLERINPYSPGNNPDNWYSCAETSGFATPGKENSQLIINSPDSDFHIEPKIMTPNQDGDNDFAQIHLQHDKSGLMANIFIYNWDGRMVKKLVNNQSIPGRAFFQWDGTDEKQNLVQEGYYLVYAEVFDLHSFSKKYKQQIVVHTD